MGKELVECDKIVFDKKSGDFVEAQRRFFAVGVGDVAELEAHKLRQCCARDAVLFEEREEKVDGGHVVAVRFHDVENDVGEAVRVEVKAADKGFDVAKDGGKARKRVGVARPGIEGDDGFGVAFRVFAKQIVVYLLVAERKKGALNIHVALFLFATHLIVVLIRLTFFLNASDVPAGMTPTGSSDVVSRRSFTSSSVRNFWVRRP